MSGAHDKGQSAGVEISSGRDAFGAGRDLTVNNYFGTWPPPLPVEGDREPGSGIRVSEADLRRLGVHAAISVTGVPDEVLPAAGIGHPHTTPLVARLLHKRLINQGREEEAEQSHWFGLNPDGSTASA